MPRVRKGATRHRKHKRVLKAARGFHGAASRRYRLALQSIFRAGAAAFTDRPRLSGRIPGEYRLAGAACHQQIRVPTPASRAVARSRGHD